MKESGRVNEPQYRGKEATIHFLHCTFDKKGWQNLWQRNLGQA